MTTELSTGRCSSSPAIYVIWRYIYIIYMWFCLITLKCEPDNRLRTTAEMRIDRRIDWIKNEGFQGLDYFLILYFIHLYFMYQTFNSSIVPDLSIDNRENIAIFKINASYMSYLLSDFSRAPWSGQLCFKIKRQVYIWDDLQYMSNVNIKKQSND